MTGDYPGQVVGGARLAREGQVVERCQVIWVVVRSFHVVFSVHAECFMDVLQNENAHDTVLEIMTFIFSKQ